MKILTFTFTLLFSTISLAEYRLYFPNKNIELSDLESSEVSFCQKEAIPEIQSLGPVLWYSSKNVEIENNKIKKLNAVGNTTVDAISVFERETFIEPNAYGDCPAIVTDSDQMKADYNFNGDELTYIFVGFPNGTYFAPLSTYTNGTNDGGLFLRSYNDSSVGIQGRPSGNEYYSALATGIVQDKPTFAAGISKGTEIRAFANGTWGNYTNIGNTYRDYLDYVSIMGDLILDKKLLPSTGKAYEIIMFDRALNENEMDSIYQALKLKYDL